MKALLPSEPRDVASSGGSAQVAPSPVAGTTPSGDGTAGTGFGSTASGVGNRICVEVSGEERGREKGERGEGGACLF